MSVHQPQAKVCFNRDSLSTIDRMEGDFLRSSVSFPEDDWPISDRWWRILTALPQIRGRHIYDDLSDILTEVYQRGRGDVVGACIDVMLLRQRFFQMLIDNNIGRLHVNYYEIDASIVWRDKLMDRLDRDGDYPDLMDGQYTPAKTEPPSTHKWIQ